MSVSVGQVLVLSDTPGESGAEEEEEAEEAE